MPTWMIVEDEPDIQDVVTAMFAIWGVSGIAFADGPEAVVWVDGLLAGHVRVGELPDLALLDIRLPTLSGIEVSRRLRGSPVLGGMAILLMTAYRLTPVQEREVLAMSGADMLLYKPLPGMIEFQSLLERLVRQKQELRRAARRAVAR